MKKLKDLLQESLKEDAKISAKCTSGKASIEIEGRRWTLMVLCCEILKSLAKNGSLEPEEYVDTIASMAKSSMDIEKKGGAAR